MLKILATLTGALVLTTCAAIAAEEAAKEPGQSAHQTMAKSAGGKSSGAIIAKAMSAAPPEVAKGAAIMSAGSDGQMKELRAGKNGWMCMVDPTGTPMCLDKEWQAWADAWINKKDPPQPKAVGIAYMLKGDTGASNTDPYATKKTADNAWVVSPAHIMILVTDPAQLDAFPTDPNTGGAWVMWKGTKYAHIMVPTGPMPKGAAKDAPKEGAEATTK
jgi:hypothetical protein